jgi:ArsR family transcriptional regulator, arsenate/arsenite/antimonite-responsive transcriptional repressor
MSQAPTKPQSAPSESATCPPLCCSPLRSSAIDDESAVRLARAFAALSDPARLRLLNLIATAPAGEACACDLVEPIGKSQPTVSHHLKILHEAGLISREKRGIWMWFRPNTEAIDALRAVLS